MNDPGVDGALHEAADDIERDPHEAEEKEEEEEEEDFLDPTRWWFASTACPLIAGTFGPMANAFSICALVQNWRVYIPPGVDEAHGKDIKDPQWLIAINSVSLVFALVANMALLLNMARRLSFAIAQSITIVGWFISSILLIALVCVASSSLFRNQPAESHALSQAFYYAIIAAALYCVVSSLMVVTVYGAYRNHYPKEFQLTSSQRTLMLQTISFMVYLLLGALVYTKIEGWEFLDAVYWANFTLLTIGIGGEYVPATHLGRSLLFPYAIGGILTVGLVIGSIRSLALERGKHKMSARFMEKKRQRVLASVDPDERTIKIGPFKKIKFSQKGLSELQRREQEFNIMRHVQKSAEKRRRWTSLAMSTIAALLLWFLGALVFTYSEKPQGWSYFVSLYFAYTSLLTIGYGDYTLSSNASKPFFVFWTMLAVPTLTILISNMGDTIIKAFSDFTLWIGSLTVLPGENSTMANLKSAAKKLQDGRFRNQRVKFEKPPGLEITGDDSKDNKLSDKGLDRLAQHIEGDELEEAEQAEKEGNTLERDIHFYHFILAKELQQVMKDVDASPPRQYSYQEWAYYLRLLGQDETDASRHRKAPVKEDKSRRNGIGNGNDESGERVAWSWLGTRSPLMGNKSEAQWLLEKLLGTLEREMRKMRRSSSQDHMEPPPLSMAELRKKPPGPGSEKNQES
ncbi:potassium channel-like protein [Lophium mytilinum]|uniref:Potassium channel-like protein n=1 Tax=Lophium mytilinum TaxID=390894 RepID=A0A6A6REU9_9PEZI|nr:potassium channel-like protein [Lophium mytilinum]